MKAILVLAASLFAFNAFAGVKNLSYSVKAHTENAVLEKVENTIPKILSGEVQSYWQKHCWPNNERTISINSVSVNKYYAVDGNNKLVAVYKGTISYHHNSCNDR